MQGWADSDASWEKGRRVLPVCRVTQAGKAVFRLSLSQPPKSKATYISATSGSANTLILYLNRKYFKLSCELSYLA